MTHVPVKPASELLFRWRPLKPQWLPKLLALVIAGAAFALLATIRIRVPVLEKSVPRRASVIYLRDDALGRAMSLRAGEGGPFPSRFQLAEWEGMAAMERDAMDATKFRPAPYVPPLPDLPAENQLRPLEFAAKGQLFFPQREAVTAVVPALAPVKLAPALFPLAGISKETLPRDLPGFESPVDGAMAAAAWRFLIRLNPDGGVAECVSLEKAGEAGSVELAAWLHRVRFAAEPGKPFRWIAVGIDFTNQPADGTDAR